jgi:hypothetical protein
MEKKCITCNEYKDISEFYQSKRKRSGNKVHIASHCKTCSKIIGASYTKKYRKRYREFKKTYKCERCGIADHRVLEFHHKDGELKEANVSELYAAKDKSKEEADKCLCLCSNCHKIIHFDKTHDEHGNPITIIAPIIKKPKNTCINLFK